MKPRQLTIERLRRIKALIHGLDCFINLATPTTLDYCVDEFVGCFMRYLVEIVPGVEVPTLSLAWKRMLDEFNQSNPSILKMEKCARTMHKAAKYLQAEWLKLLQSQRHRVAPPTRKKPRSCYERDHAWCDQYLLADSPTFHRPAVIRNKWNAQHPRDQVTVDDVKKGVRKALRERHK
jgi:hypothetical protein